jgi:hypothetical protein
MNRIKTTLVLAVMLLVSSSLVLLVNATPASNEGSLNSGYAVTNNYHGIDVPSGAQVIVTAMSTDSDVDYVIFTWKNAAGDVVYEDTVNVFTNGTKFNGKTIRYAISIHAPNSLGDWGVQARFYDKYHGYKCGHDTKLATRSTSFNVVPEVPLLGTAGVAVAMVLGLTVFKAKRSNHKSNQ